MTVSGVIAYALYRYTKRRDRLDFLRSRWAEQQLVNLNQLGSDENLAEQIHHLFGETVPPPKPPQNS
jgi:hypothetical protein